MIPLRKKTPAAPAEPARRFTVVVADDVDEIQALVANWLEEVGHQVTRVSNGREVVRIMKEQAFDLLVTDLVMPEGDGWDAILAVNRLRPATKILAISGGAKEMPAAACLRVAKGVGADGVLLKPFGRPQFFDAVEKVMS
jgi:CheY-like chemotaxis protein